MPQTGGWLQRARLRQGPVQTHVAQKCCSILDGALFDYSRLPAGGRAYFLANPAAGGRQGVTGGMRRAQARVPACLGASGRLADGADS